MKLIALILTIFALSLPAYAADKAAPAKQAKPAVSKPQPKKPKSGKLSEKDRATVKKAENYLNNLKAARARFVQTTHDGTQLVGTFYLQRPGKLRFEYDPPVEDFVVADGTFIYFYDAELKEQSNAPIGQTLADFILRPQLKLDGDLKVTSLKRSGDLLQIEVTQSSDPEAGKLILGFKEDSMTLKKWRIVDAQGLITEVELFYLKTDITHPAGLFAYKDPKPSKLNE
jgi:outer membrane lipoprotein-sorting protein